MNYPSTSMHHCFLLSDNVYVFIDSIGILYSFSEKSFGQLAEVCFMSSINKWSAWSLFVSQYSVLSSSSLLSWIVTSFLSNLSVIISRFDLTIGSVTHMWLRVLLHLLFYLIFCFWLMLLSRLLALCSSYTFFVFHSFFFF